MTTFYPFIPNIEFELSKYPPPLYKEDDDETKTYKNEKQRINSKSFFDFV